jgi:hypothetical protein
VLIVTRSEAPHRPNTWASLLTIVCYVHNKHHNISIHRCFNGANLELSSKCIIVAFWPCNKIEAALVSATIQMVRPFSTTKRVIMGNSFDSEYSNEFAECINRNGC